MACVGNVFHDVCASLWFITCLLFFLQKDKLLFILILQFLQMQRALYLYLKSKDQSKLCCAKVFIHLSKHFPKLRIMVNNGAVFCPKMHFYFRSKHVFIWLFLDPFSPIVIIQNIWNWCKNLLMIWRLQYFCFIHFVKTFLTHLGFLEISMFSKILGSKYSNIQSNSFSNLSKKQVGLYCQYGDNLLILIQIKIQIKSTCSFPCL